ncbi:hypothetical protein EDD11_000183 [Mortierella claussenii]|nr:hypothetical protein EDD11_000183 [Mortierella claussenii]
MGLYAPPSMATVLRYPPSGVENSNNISHKDEVVGEEKGGILTFKATVDAPNLINRYDIVSNFWTLSPSTIKVLVPRRYGIEAVTDPRSGLVYLLGGYHSWLLDSMAVYNPYMDVMATKPLVQEPGHQEAEVAGLAFFSAAWVPNLSSVLYMGGKSDLYPDRTTAKVALYSPQEDRWTSVITTGDVPQDMDGACLAIDVVRRQAILFGGSGHFQDSNQISFLNLNTTSHTAFCWRRGRHAQQSRRNMACAAQGRFFVVWGGKVNNTIGDFQSPMVYDLIKDQWVDRYDPSL